MTIEEITIKVVEGKTGEIHRVRISTDNLIQAIKSGEKLEYLWLYITGWIQGEKNVLNCD